MTALHAAVLAALQQPEVLGGYTELGLTPAPQTPAQLAEFIRAEATRRGAAIRTAGVTVE